MRNGEAVYDEQMTKGILLPLKFQFKKLFEKGNVLKDVGTPKYSKFKTKCRLFFKFH